MSEPNTSEPLHSSWTRQAITVPGSAMLLDLAEEVDRHAADRRQQDLDVGPGHELGEHPPGLLEQGAPQIGFGDAETGGQPGQMPDRIDRRLGDADLAIVEQNLAVRPQGPVGEKRAELGRGNSRPSDRDRRTYVDAGADLFRKDLADEMAPRDRARRSSPDRPIADAVRSSVAGAVSVKSGRWSRAKARVATASAR